MQEEPYQYLSTTYTGPPAHYYQVDPSTKICAGDITSTTIMGR